MNFFSSKESVQIYYDNGISEDDKNNTYALKLDADLGLPRRHSVSGRDYQNYKIN